MTKINDQIIQNKTEKLKKAYNKLVKNESKIGQIELRYKK